MLGQLFSTEMQVGMILIVILLLALYVLSIIWVVRDAYSRGAKWKFWGLIALIPIAGLIAYLLMRPPLYLIDRDEQELEIAIKQRELMKYGECSRCGFPVQSDYIVCPNCQQQLKQVCKKCGRPLEFKWNACPYCGAPKQNVASASNSSFAPMPVAQLAPDNAASSKVNVQNTSSGAVQQPTASSVANSSVAFDTSTASSKPVSLNESTVHSASEDNCAINASSKHNKTQAQGSKTNGK